MKAYMSDSTGRWRVAYDTCRCLVATATAEARALQAEAEPESGPYGTVLLSLAETRQLVGESEALAAGLAWFIALDIKGDIEGFAH